MSQRMIVEINTDYTGEIVRRPEDFATAIKTLCDHGRCMDARTKHDLDRFGVRLLDQAHHTERLVFDWHAGRAERRGS